MALLFKITRKGESDARGMYAGAAKRARNLAPALRNLGEEFVTSNAQRIAAGLDVDGRPFAKSRRAEKFGGQTMFNTGALASSVNYEARSRALEMFSTDPRAAVHYDGKLIKPRRAKFLTIPLRAPGGMFAGVALTTKGNRAGDRARHYKDTFFLRRGARLFLMQKVGGGKQLRALFMLVKSIQMKKRKWFGFGSRELARAQEAIPGYIAGDNK